MRKTRFREGQQPTQCHTVSPSVGTLAKPAQLRNPVCNLRRTENADTLVSVGTKWCSPWLILTEGGPFPVRPRLHPLPWPSASPSPQCPVPFCKIWTSPEYNLPSFPWRNVQLGEAEHRTSEAVHEAKAATLLCFPSTRCSSTWSGLFPGPTLRASVMPPGHFHKTLRLTVTPVKS